MARRKSSEVIGNKKFTKRDCVHFIQDMEKAGLTLRFYEGRYFWKGPAVFVDSIQEALSETKIKCNWDNMGRGFVVYPCSSDAGINLDSLVD